MNPKNLLPLKIYSKKKESDNMARRIANSTLNASTLDILNVIRANASYDYQQKVPKVETANDIPRVGEIIYGTPAFANQFLNALINRIAIVRIQSATFNNPYSALKKGYLEFGETVEDIFVGIINAVEYTPEKGAEREFKRSLPDVRSAFHVMNWRVMYPVTIQDEDLYQAFLSLDGVTSLIANIVEQVYTSAEYDEFLLFKYLLIKAITKGKLAPVSIGTGADLKVAAEKFRGTSNKLPFMSRKYNEADVKTTTPKDRQVIFMDADFNASFDVQVLASAFNMDKADFMGRLHLIDNWTEFDNERFEIIRENSDGIEEITAEELALMADVKAVILDEKWFQVYDNKNKFTEKYVASGLYWNYFYHTWKTVSNSPFANAIVFVTSNATITNPSTITVKITDKDVSDVATTLTVEVADSDTLQPSNVQFVQTEDLIEKGIAVHKFGGYIIPASAFGNAIQIVAKIGEQYYTNAGTTISDESNVGASVTLSAVDAIDPVTMSPFSGTMYEVASTSVQENLAISGNQVSGTLKYLSGSNPITDVWGAGNFMMVEFNADDWADYTSVKVGLEPSKGSGLVELIGEDDKSGVFKISNKNTQKFKIVATNGVTTEVKTYNLGGLTLNKS